VNRHPSSPFCLRLTFEERVGLQGQPRAVSSREMFLENGWTMPKGLIESKARDPLNLTLKEWQQAKRQGYDAKAMKAAITECWAVSDSRPRSGAVNKPRQTHTHIISNENRSSKRPFIRGHIASLLASKTEKV
jgi:hypothetical protein